MCATRLVNDEDPEVVVRDGVTDLPLLLRPSPTFFSFLSFFLSFIRAVDWILPDAFVPSFFVPFLLPCLPFPLFLIIPSLARSLTHTVEASRWSNSSRESTLHHTKINTLILHPLTSPDPESPSEHASHASFAHSPTQDAYRRRDRLRRQAHC
jgi:hypothetical protein